VIANPSHWGNFVIVDTLAAVTSPVQTAGWLLDRAQRR
jgi:hypothetical protein